MGELMMILFILGQRKWKVDLFSSYPYAGVTTKKHIP